MYFKFHSLQVRWRQAVVPAVCLTGLNIAVAASPESRDVPLDALSLDQLTELALAHSPQLQSSHWRQQAYQEDASLASYWPRPNLNVSMLNLPTDSLDLRQEPMTQLQLSLSQPIPQGQTLALSSQWRRQQAEVEALRKQWQQAMILRQVRQHWLSVQVSYQAVGLVDHSRAELESLQKVVSSRYRYVSSSAQQTELAILAAEQEQLLDQTLLWQQQAGVARQRLNEFLPEMHWRTVLQANEPLGLIARPDLDLNQIRHHPAIALAQLQAESGETSVALAREQDKPRWRLQAAYGYRSDDASGQERADFISVGVGVELPWFSGNQSHHRVQAAVNRQKADWSQLQQVKQELASGLNQWRAEAEGLQARLERLSSHRLPLVDARIDAAEAAYRHDSGSFTDLIQARLARLKTELEQVQLQHRLVNARIQQMYFLTSTHSGRSRSVGYSASGNSFEDAIIQPQTSASAKGGFHDQ